MDFLSFISANFRTFAELISAFAWPMSLVAIVWLLRRELGSLIDGIKRVSYPGGETLIERDLAQAAYAEKKVKMEKEQAREEAAVQVSLDLEGIPARQGNANGPAISSAGPSNQDGLLNSMDYDFARVLYGQFQDALSMLIRSQDLISDEAKKRYLSVLPLSISPLTKAGVLTQSEASQIRSLQTLWRTLRDTNPNYISSDQLGMFKSLAESTIMIINEKLAGELQVGK